MARTGTWDHHGGAAIKPNVSAVTAGTQRTITFPNYDLNFGAPSFTAPTLLNSWVNNGSGWAAAGYYKDAFGFVHLKGLVKSGTVGAAIFTLPSGYRPAENETFAVQSNTAFGYCNVGSDGNVGASGGSNVNFSLSGIVFYAGW